MIEMKWCFPFVMSFCAYLSVMAQYPNSVFLDSLLQSKPILKKVKEGSKKYRLQIIYSPITRNKKGEMTFKNHYFHVDPQNYFYCASLVKLPTSIIALEKINGLKEKGINANTTMYTDSCMLCMNKVQKDTSANDQRPSLAQYIKEMLLVSDNAAYSRVYEFCGTDLLNAKVKEWGCKHTYIINRYDGRCYQENNFNTNPVSFYDANQKLRYQQNCVKGKAIVSDNTCVKTVGKAYYSAKNKLIKQPKNFEGMNECSLPDIHLILQKLITQSPDLKITKDDWNFLMRHAALYPKEGENTHYFGKTYFDSYKKYFIYGDSKKSITNENIRIFNIVGQSYGFMSDCAYIVDFENNIEFMLSAALYANEDEVINDGRYDYNSIALPFLAELGRSILKYEQSKPKPENKVFLSPLKAMFSK